MTPFAIATPARILFGRGEAARAPALIRALGTRVLLVHGASGRHAPELGQGLADLGGETLAVACAAEPTLEALVAALDLTRGFAPQVVVGIGGGAVLDMAKALAALLPAGGPPTDYLEISGPGRPLPALPLPFVALPTTAGTGAEATKNAVIGLPGTQGSGGRKVSLRDDRMLARLAIVDPALTDHCPRGVTLASGLDAVTQVIEPYVSARATPFTDAIALPAIGTGLAALHRLMQAEDTAARDALAWTSLCGGLALANAGLGAVHGLAGVIGGTTQAAHGAICGALLGPVLRANRRHATGETAARLDRVFAAIAAVLGGPPETAPETLSAWARACGLPGLRALGLAPGQHDEVARLSLGASSMKGNPVALGADELVAVMQAAE
ncbi:MAG: iron-containing alcohol dehydrogenase [Paracoccaceae bacterium]